MFLWKWYDAPSYLQCNKTALDLKRRIVIIHGLSSCADQIYAEPPSVCVWIESILIKRRREVSLGGVKPELLVVFSPRAPSGHQHEKTLSWKCKLTNKGCSCCRRKRKELNTKQRWADKAAAEKERKGALRIKSQTVPFLYIPPRSSSPGSRVRI